MQNGHNGPFLIDFLTPVRSSCADQCYDSKRLDPDETKRGVYRPDMNGQTKCALWDNL